MWPLPPPCQGVSACFCPHWGETKVVQVSSFTSALRPTSQKLASQRQEHLLRDSNQSFYFSAPTTQTTWLPFRWVKHQSKFLLTSRHLDMLLYPFLRWANVHVAEVSCNTICLPCPNNKLWNIFSECGQMTLFPFSSKTPGTPQHLLHMRSCRCLRAKRIKHEKFQSRGKKRSAEWLFFCSPQKVLKMAIPFLPEAQPTHGLTPSLELP